MPGPIVCAVPAGTKNASPAAPGMRADILPLCSSAIARRKISRVTPGCRPDPHFRARSRAETTYHISVLPTPPAAASCRARVVVVRMHLHGKLVFRENEFHEQRECCECRAARARPLRRHLRPHFAQRASGDTGRRQTGTHCRSARLRRCGSAQARSFPEKAAARIRAAPDARERRRARDARGARFTWRLSGEEMFQPPQAFVDALDRGGIGDPQIAGRAEASPGTTATCCAFEQFARQRRWNPRTPSARRWRRRFGNT